MHTRAAYLNGTVSHTKYYGQFVDQPLRDAVAQSFGIARLQRAYEAGSHFNSIPLSEWDSWYSILNNSQFKNALQNVGDQFSLSSVVCTVKEAAMQVVEGAQAPGKKE